MQIIKSSPMNRWQINDNAWGSDSNGIEVKNSGKKIELLHKDESYFRLYLGDNVQLIQLRNHQKSDKKIKNDSNVTTLPSGRSFFADKKGRSNRCKKVVSILGKRVTDRDLLPKGFHCGK